MNNEMFFTSLKSYYQIGYISAAARSTHTFLVKDENATRNFNIHKCLHCKIGMPPSHPLT